MKEELGEIDVLLLAAASGVTADPSAAARLALALDPKIIIPLGQGEEQKGLSGFLKEVGATPNGALEKLVLKKKDLIDKESEVIILKLS